MLKVLKGHVAAIAEQLQLPPEVLIKKKDYEHLARMSHCPGQAVLPVGLQGWRDAIVGQPLLALLQQYAQQHPQ